MLTCADSLNDVRFDLRPNQSGLSSAGVAYITDSSTEGRNGIIVVDLTSGQSWRHLNNDLRLRPLEQVVPYVWGEPVYSVPSPGMPFSYLPFGSDGIALSADGNDLYFKSIAGRYLYSIPTERLRDNSATSEILAQSSVRNRGESGVSDGMETDSNGFIYAGNVEQESVSLYNPKNGTVNTFVRDQRINWVDTRKSWDTSGTLTEKVLWLTPNCKLQSLLPPTDMSILPRTSSITRHRYIQVWIGAKGRSYCSGPSCQITERKSRLDSKAK